MMYTNCRNYLILYKSSVFTLLLIRLNIFVSSTNQRIFEYLIEKTISG